MSNNAEFLKRITEWRDGMQRNLEVAKRNLDDAQTRVSILNDVIGMFEEIQSESIPVAHTGGGLFNPLRAENQEYEAAISMLEKAKKALAEAEAEHKELEVAPYLTTKQFARMQELEKLITIYKEFLS